MLWNHLINKTQHVSYPWTGKKVIYQSQEWDTPSFDDDYGWYNFELFGRKAILKEPADLNSKVFQSKQFGYLIGSAFFAINSGRKPIELVEQINAGRLIEIRKILNALPKVKLIEPGLDKFQYISVGFLENGECIFNSIEMPVGSEQEILSKYLDGINNIDDIQGVNPALYAAFKVEVWQRDEAEKARKEEQARLEKEAADKKRREEFEKISQTLGDGASRRALGFDDAAKLALKVSGAEYIDSRKSYNKNEMIVRFRFKNQRYECVCHERTMRIIDAGICLTDHDTGVKGDGRLTLESLPAVIAEAVKLGELVIFRHA